MRPWILVTLSTALLAGPLVPWARADERADEISLEQVMIESATTPEQHAALANYYAEKAAEARKSAEYHRTMAMAYGGSKIEVVAGMKQHCLNIASLYNEQAKEYDKLEAMQRGFAK